MERPVASRGLIREFFPVRPGGGPMRMRCMAETLAP